VVLVANAASTYLQCLTTEQVTTIWQAASNDTITQWSQVSSDYPDEQMTLFAPTAGDPTTDLMLLTAAGESNIINRDDTEQNADPLYRAAATANVEGALTLLSWPEYERVQDNNQQNVQLVSIDAGDGCVSPNQDSIADGTYPLARPGQLMVNQAALSRVEVMSFLWYAVSDENLQALLDAGFVGVDFGDLAAARTTLQDTYAEASAAALQAEATAEPGAESTVEPDAAAEPVSDATAEPAAESAATADATEDSNG
jgi:phosphate transport system substrate-binding protein